MLFATFYGEYKANFGVIPELADNGAPWPAGGPGSQGFCLETRSWRCRIGAGQRDFI